MRPLPPATIAAVAIMLGFASAGHAADVCTTELGQAESAIASALRGDQHVPAAGLSEADSLAREAEAACRQGDAIMASRKTQEALGILKSAPGSGQQGIGDKKPPSEKAPGLTRPRDADFYQPSPNVTHEPMFIGPTGKIQTGEFGFSAWIAPTTPVGSELARGRENGTSAIGFTFTWRGPARRPEPVETP